MERVEVLLYVIDVCVAGIINYHDVVHISKICSDVVFVAKVHKVRIFEVLKEEFCYES